MKLFSFSQYQRFVLFLFIKIQGVAQRPTHSQEAFVYHYHLLEVKSWCHFHFLESHQSSSLLRNFNRRHCEYLLSACAEWIHILPDLTYYYQISASQYHRAPCVSASHGRDDVGHSASDQLYSSSQSTRCHPANYFLHIHQQNVKAQGQESLDSLAL